MGWLRIVWRRERKGGESNVMVEERTILLIARIIK
jgi:hypothetical protein